MLLGHTPPLLDSALRNANNSRQSCFASGCANNHLKAVVKMLHASSVKPDYTVWQEVFFTDSGKALLHHRGMQTHIFPMSDHKKVVGARLRKIIDIIGLQYTEAADIMGVSKQVLRNWMSGESYPAPYSLYKLCKSKGVNFDYIFLGNWDHLPHHLAKVLEQELEDQLEKEQANSAALAHTDADKT